MTLIIMTANVEFVFKTQVCLFISHMLTVTPQQSSELPHTVTMELGMWLNGESVC